jgi:hypothetical protein
MIVHSRSWRVSSSEVSANSAVTCSFSSWKLALHVLQTQLLLSVILLDTRQVAESAAFGGVRNEAGIESLEHHVQPNSFSWSAPKGGSRMFEGANITNRGISLRSVVHNAQQKGRESAE